MRAGTVWAALAVAAICGSASAEIGVTRAHLISGPSDAEIAAAWPQAAQKAGIKGEARIQCAVSKENVLSDCKVLEERPAGQGFGQAALAMVPKFKAQTASVEARPTDSIVRFILKFPPGEMDTETAGPYTLPEAAAWPTADELYSAWPRMARANHVEGSASLNCTVSLYGEVQDCAVASESIKNMGFGQAALVLAQKVRFLPGTKDTMSIAMRMPIGFSFECGTRCTPMRLPETFSGKLVAVTWTKVPSSQVLASAYPTAALAAHQTGKVLLFCRMKADGGVHACQVMSEEPQKMGFGAAAERLAATFESKANKDNEGAGVQIPITFSDEAGAAILVRGPSGEDLGPLLQKAGADPNLTRAAVILGCKVGEGGAVQDCRLVSEDPAGLGLGETALTLAPKFGVSPWGENGRPTLGSSIRVPLRVEVKAPAMASADKPIEIKEPDWEHRPTATDMERYYPERALAMVRSGDAALSCTVTTEGRLQDCLVSSESPPGLGFGAAALKLASLFKMKPPSIDGHPLQGGTVTVPIRFRIQ